MKILFLIFIINNVLKFSFSKCRMQQTCDVDQPDCRPEGANNTEPEVLLGPNVICPEYYNQTACCNNGQNKLLKKNFDSLDSVFGTKYGGCDICSVNLKRFYCHFTCSPHQDTFSFKDFEIEKVNYTLLMINLTVNSQTNCDLFNSCKKTKYASQVVAMGNAIGFTTFQGTEAYRKAPIFLSMLYSKEGGMEFPIDPCDTVPIDGKVRGFDVEETCKCNSCAKSCKYDTRTTFPILEGFSLATVLMFYFTVMLFTLIIHLCKCYFKKPNDHSRTSSIESDNINENMKENLNTSSNNTNRTQNNINNNLSLA